MPDMIQVKLPVAQKDYAMTPRPINTGEQFNLAETTKVSAMAARTEQNQGDNAMFDENALQKLSMEISGNASSASASLKDLLSGATLSMLGKSGENELLAKVTEFASEIMLSADDLAADLQSQQSEQTKFSGKFFDTLRSIMNGGYPQDTKAAVANLLKAIVNASSRQDILNNLSGSMQYLADELSPSASLSAKLAELAKELASPNAAQNFGALKGEVLNMLNTLSSSLLLTDKTRSLMSLVNYNLSRFNGNPAVLKDAITALLEKINNPQLAEQLSGQWSSFVEDGSFPSDVKFMTLINYQNTLEEAASPNPVFENLTSEASISAISKYLSELADTTMSKVNADELKLALMNINKLSGTPTDTLKHMLTLITGVNGAKAVDMLMNDFASTGDLNMLIERLGIIINNIDNTDAKIAVAQSFNELLTQISSEQGINYKPPTSMDNFISFLSKNINDNALRQLNPLTREDILQSMLTAPGVFTPLLHFLLPLEDENMRAFGELWVDNTAVPEDEDSGSHMFLCFDVVDVGYFELELYSKKEELSVMLFTPPEFADGFRPMKTVISRLAASKGYSLRNSAVEPLKGKRDLTAVFPKLNEKRGGLNAKV